MRLRAFILAAVSTLLGVVVPAHAAEEDAQVRFAHAVPGVGNAELSVDGVAVGEAGFGAVGDSASVPAGPAKLLLTAPGGVRVSGNADLDAGASYTLVGLAQGDGAEIRTYRDGEARPGLAKLRMIHAAPELGEPDLALNGETVVEGISFTEGTKYWTLEPGDYELVVEDPKSGKAVFADQISLPAGASRTALLVGSGGEKTRVVLADDDVAAPAGAPATGLGGLAGGGAPEWLAALLAALAAAGAGLAGFARLGRRDDVSA